MINPPLCFIGSSTEGEEYAEALRVHLDDAGIPAQLWSLNTFLIGDQTMARLVQALDECSFAVFVATPDDNVTKRGANKLAPRDNVILEFGMFLGRLGGDRTFLLVPKDLKELHLPSDLLGITLGPYTYKPDADLGARRAAMKARADEIIDRVKQLQWVEPPLDGAMVDDLLQGLSRHLMDPRATSSDGAEAWAQGLLNTVQERFVNRAEDAYAAWLRPGGDDRLHVRQQSNLPRGYADHGWGRDEGLAGRVWVTGKPAAVSELKGHPWFEPRESCANESYVCAAVGAAGGLGGVLAVGSDTGFREERGDLGFVSAYAAALSLAATPLIASEDSFAAIAQDLMKTPRRFARSLANRSRLSG